MSQSNMGEKTAYVGPAKVDRIKSRLLQEEYAKLAADRAMSGLAKPLRKLVEKLVEKRAKAEGVTPDVVLERALHTADMSAVHNSPR